MNKIATENETTLQTMLNPMLQPFKLVCSGFLADKTPITPVMVIQIPNQIPEPVLLTQWVGNPATHPIPKRIVKIPITI